MMAMEIEVNSLKELEKSIEVIKENIEVSVFVTSEKCGRDRNMARA
jgi:hypothetical protein